MVTIGGKAQSLNILHVAVVNGAVLSKGGIHESEGTRAEAADVDSLEHEVMALNS